MTKLLITHVPSPIWIKAGASTTAKTGPYAEGSLYWHLEKIFEWDPEIQTIALERTNKGLIVRRSS